MENIKQYWLQKNKLCANIPNIRHRQAVYPVKYILYTLNILKMSGIVIGCIFL